MNRVEEIYSRFRQNPLISTDSRDIRPGSIFFALKGEHFDGNRFAAEALEKGAAYSVIDDPSLPSDDRFIRVPDSLAALQVLASLHRSRITAKVIGITGSNGKTTTKELIGRVLSTSFNTTVTSGNLNNHIGVPVTLLSISPETEFAVVEMGANHPGEIASLCRIARPAFGIITNIGKAHLEGFGSLEGVARAKSELYDFLRNNSGRAFVNADNNLLMSLSTGLDRTTYGTSEQALIRGALTGNDPFLSVSWQGNNRHGMISSKLFGAYNFENILAAVCIGTFFGIVPEKISSAVSTYIPENKRSQVTRTSRNTLMLDSYNANPTSMAAALENFRRVASKPAMVILGDMMELGERSSAEHWEIIELVRQLDLDRAFLVGEFFSRAATDGPETCFSNIAEAEDYFRRNPVTGVTILLKGSRKMELEKLIPLF